MSPAYNTPNVSVSVSANRAGCSHSILLSWGMPWLKHLATLDVALLVGACRDLFCDTCWLTVL